MKLFTESFYDNVAAILDTHASLKHDIKDKLKFKIKPKVALVIQISISMKNKKLVYLKDSRYPKKEETL